MEYLIYVTTLLGIPYLLYHYNGALNCILFTSLAICRLQLVTEQLFAYHSRTAAITVLYLDANNFICIDPIWL